MSDGMCDKGERNDAELRWFILLVRQGLKLIVAGIESRYGIGEDRKRSA